MKEIIIPETYNYIAAFLTLSCNLRCSYCINKFGNTNYKKGLMTDKQWVEGLNRIVSRDDLPITIQGGEPSLHPDFIYIINNIKSELNVDILTNLRFNVDKFISEVNPNRLKRNSPYASIRVSYHPETMLLLPLIKKVLILKKAGFSIGIWTIVHPQYLIEITKAKKLCIHEGIDFRVKEFLGIYNNKLYGKYKYPGACNKKFRTKPVKCITTELIIGPTGNIYRCHNDLYGNMPIIGHLLDDNEFEIKDHFRYCGFYGFCNPCDVKIKTNRYQIYGHTSVEIKKYEKSFNN